MRRTVLLVHMIVCLAVLGWMVRQKEEILATGVSVYLELQPRDPRLPLMGDYMELRYLVAGAAEAAGGDRPGEGMLVLVVDTAQVGRFARFAAPGERASEKEILIRYRSRSGGIRIGAEAFTFPEGEASRYEAARFAELSVEPGGEGRTVLRGLRDANLVLIP